jgi:hypothetical protein
MFVRGSSKRQPLRKGRVRLHEKAMHPETDMCVVTAASGGNRAMAKALSRFTIERAGDEFMLHIEDEDGDTLELTASFEQLDLISESLEEHLAFDIDDPDEIDDEEEEKE